LNQGFRGAKLLRSVSLLPWVMPSAVTAILWAWILNGQYGVLNAYLIQLNIIADPVVWLASPSGAMAAVVLAKSWLSIALVMTFFLASLQSLPMDQVEAARLDGATNMKVIRHVVLPHVRKTAVVVTVLQAMGNLQQIDLIYALTGGGPAGATSVMVHHYCSSSIRISSLLVSGVSHVELDQQYCQDSVRHPARRNRLFSFISSLLVVRNVAQTNRRDNCEVPCAFSLYGNPRSLFSGA
jgi:ABC-type sugar transport system permease subunit